MRHNMTDVMRYYMRDVMRYVMRDGMMNSMTNTMTIYKMTQTVKLNKPKMAYSRDAFPRD